MPYGHVRPVSIFNLILVPVLLLAAGCYTVLAEEKPAPINVPAEAAAKPDDPKKAPEKDEKDESPQAPAQLEPVHVTERIVTTPARIPEPVKKTGVSVTVIDGKEDREVFQNIQLADSLKDVPGVTTGRSGFNGDFGTIFTRGGNSNQTLFLYDGFEVNRQGGNFNLGPVDPVSIDRIEVVRGPSSSLYGADAVTGTINVVTAKGAGRPDLVTSVAGGSFGTDRETVEIQGSEKKFSYNVSSAHLHRETAGFPNSDASIYSYAGRFDYQIDDCSSLKAVIRGLDERKGFYEDTGSGYGPAVERTDPNDSQREQDLLTGLEYRNHILPIWDLTARLGNYAIDYRTTSNAPNPPSNFGVGSQALGFADAREYRPQFDLQNDITAFEDECGDVKDIITAGFNFKDEHFKQKDTQFGNNLTRSRTNYSGFVQDHIELFERAFFTAGLREEENEQFGSFTTGHGDGSILIPESDTRVHGSVGTAFRAPSFFEFFGAFGNPNLKPERNFAWDAGLEQNFWCKRITLGATYFENRFHDLINFDAAFKFSNISQAKTNGYELYGEFKPIEMLTLRGTGTLQHTEDAKGQELLRRPGETYTGSAIVRPIRGLDFSLDVLHEGPRRDLGPLPGNPFGKPINQPFTRVDLAGSYRFMCHWRVFGRVENLANQRYQEVLTFPSPRVNFLSGVEFNIRF